MEKYDKFTTALKDLVCATLRAKTRCSTSVGRLPANTNATITNATREVINLLVLQRVIRQKSDVRRGDDDELLLGLASLSLDLDAGAASPRMTDTYGEETIHQARL